MGRILAALLVLIFFGGFLFQEEIGIAIKGDPEAEEMRQARRNAVVPTDGASYDIGEVWFAFAKITNRCVGIADEFGLDRESSNDYLLLRSPAGLQEVTVRLYRDGQSDADGDVCTA